MKGFIFTLLVIVAITMMITELNLYFAAYQLREQNEPSKIRSFVLGELANQLSPYNMQKASAITGYDALYALTVDCTANPAKDKATLGEDMFSVMKTGRRFGSVSQLIADNKTLTYFTGKLSAMADKMGFKLSTSFSDPLISQPADPWTVRFDYNFTYSLSDSFTNTLIETSYPVSFNISIKGFDDPLFESKTSQIRNIVPMQPVSSWTSFVGSGDRGRGWFYGNITYLSTWNNDYSPDNKAKILVTDKVDLARQYGNIYGAVLILGTTATSLQEIRVPFMTSNIAFTSLPNAVLIVSDNDTAETTSSGGHWHMIYYIETIRHFALCGYYNASTEAPSFLDRLVKDRPGKTFNDGMGIETMVVGEWLKPPYVSRSAIDYIMFNENSPTVNKTMGMPGCRWMAACNAAGGDVLPMRLDVGQAQEYNLTQMICQGVRCG